MQPFTCPQCGAHTYTVVLTGCAINNATLEETYEWDEEQQGYTSVGTILVESEEVSPESTQAICTGCEMDVTEAVAQYETTVNPPEEEAAGA